ncbi:MAG: dTDP-4-dehydrorhamnose 3,5-epimerase [Glaciimonas sp.]|nr:dTDP-4-dehydrorhamnose 3,5-epimerase [Glaciimonas sp.]
MKATPLAIPDIVLIEPQVYRDERGFFFESFNQNKFEAAIGQQVNFVQDNHSRSTKNVLRGLHYQIVHPQGKLVRVIQGKILDVAVDLRRTSSSFGKCVAIELSEENQRQIWIPSGFAHGFQVMSETADVIYKTTDYYDPRNEHCVAWNDPSIPIEWPHSSNPILSVKDKLGKLLIHSEVFQ